MKIGIFGGTFNPPHLGHISMARTALHELPLERLFVVPTAVPPHKQMTDAVDGELRLEMARIAFGTLPRCEVSDVELRRRGKSYTVDTLRHFAAVFPQGELCFLLGGDMLRTMEQWREFEEILRLATLVAFRRETDERLEQAAGHLTRRYGAHIRLVEAPVIEVSSTQLREKIRNGERPTEFVPQGVLDFVIQNNLYGGAR